MGGYTSRAGSSDDRAPTPARFDELLERHRKTLLQYVLKQVPDRETAEDVLQEASVRAWRSFSEFRGKRGDPSFVGWMRQIVNRRAADFYRGQWSRSSRTVDIDDIDIADEVDVAGEAVSAQLGVDDVLADMGLGGFIAALPPRQAAAFRLRCACELRGTPELTVPTIAKCLRTTSKAAQHLDQRSKKRLQELLRAELIAHRSAGLAGDGSAELNGHG